MDYTMGEGVTKKKDLRKNIKFKIVFLLSVKLPKSCKTLTDSLL